MRFKQLYGQKVEEYLQIISILEDTYGYFPIFCGPVVVKMSGNNPVGIYRDINRGYTGYILNDTDILRDYGDGTYGVVFFDPIFSEMICADTNTALSYSIEMDHIREIYSTHNLPDNLYEWTTEQELLYKLSKE